MEDPSLNKVANRLNQEGFRTKIRKTKKGVQTGGGEFNKDVIKRLLRNQIYIGFVKYKDMEFKGLHDAIIDENLFEKVQKRLNESQIDRHLLQQGKTNLTLLGITRCGLCGKNLTSTYTKKSNGKYYYYYKCVTAIKGSKSQCNAKDIGAEELETFVRKLINQIANDDELFLQIYKHLKKHSTDDSKELKNSIEELSKNLTKINKEITDLTEKIIRIPYLEKIKSLSDKLIELEQSKSFIENELLNYRHKLDYYKNTSVSKTDLRKIIKDFDEIYYNLPIETKRRLNQLLFVEIISYVKRDSNNGDIVFKIRADGNIKADFYTIKNPKDPGSKLWGGWLRERDRYSKKIRLNLPISLIKIARGKIKIAIDDVRISNFLHVESREMTKFIMAF